MFLAPHIGLRAGLEAEATMVRVWANLDTSKKVPAQTEASLRVESALREIYVLGGVKAWTFVDEDGEDIEVSEATIRDILLSDFSLSRPVGDKADELYTNSVLDPLLARVSKSSRSTRTSGSTSPSRPSSEKRPRPLKPSSTTTSDRVPRSA